MPEEIIVIYTMDSINLTFRCVCIENIDAAIMSRVRKYKKVMYKTFKWIPFGRACELW